MFTPEVHLGGSPCQHLYALDSSVSIRISSAGGCKLGLDRAPLTYIIILPMYDSKDCVISVIG